MAQDIEMSSPYRPYDLESGDWFYHEDLVKQIKEIFNLHPEDKFIVLHGDSGSGKTSTLKRIANTPGLLGKNYIPIYLDSRDYIEINADDLLFFVYRDVIGKLIKMGYEAQEADYVKKRHQKGYTVESIILTVDSMLKPHGNSKETILVLIFDEFDKLLENTEANVLSGYVKYFGYIEKSWSNYGLILAGDKKLVNLTRSETVKQFLGKAFPINFEHIFDEKTITELIINPVKGKLTYDDDAIRKIIWYSGKNLYFQQLICHYLVKHLKKEKKSRCSVEDVARAIQKILNEPIQEFVYGWESKVSMESRLIASALADESETEHKGNYYYLKENSLIYDIFGEELYEKIKKLQDFGYFNKMDGQRFLEFPFKVPLYGEWIKVRHPFIDTILENLEAISDRISLSTLKKIIMETSRNKLMPFDHEEAVEIIDNWSQLRDSISQNQNSVGKVSRIHIKRFIESFSSFLNTGLNSKPGAEKYFIFDIKDFNIGTLEDAYCFVQDRPELKKEDISDIENTAAVFAEKNQTKSTIFFYFQESEMVENFVKKSYLNLIAINENDLKKIVISIRPRDTFRKIILGRLSLQKISPYQTAGPAKTTFYGRSDIIDRIGSSKNKSFSIVGARRIGKTSLLNKLCDEPPPGTLCIFMDLDPFFYSVKSDKKFLQALEYELEQRFKKKNAFGKLPFTKNLNKLPNIIQELSPQGQHIVFIFDEIDGLLDFDKKNGYEIMRIFRTMSQKNLCQFIFAGFKELYHLQRDMENPLYNFCEGVRLQPLDNSAALELITKPMESMGVCYRNEADKELILYYTGCHPNLLQYFCKNLVEKIEKHDKAEERRTIFSEDIEDLFDKEYQEYILDDVYLFKTDMSAVNRLILILLVQAHPSGNGKHFSVEEIRTQLAAHGIKPAIKDLHRDLKYLVMRFVLVDEGKDIYKFALPVFPEILRKRVDDDYKYDIIEEIKANETQSL